MKKNTVTQMLAALLIAFAIYGVAYAQPSYLAAPGGELACALSNDDAAESQETNYTINSVNAGRMTLRKSGTVFATIDRDGTVRARGYMVGKFDSDGSIRVSGYAVGKIEQDGRVTKSGQTVGQIDSDGTVRVKGTVIGKVDKSGNVYKSGSTIGRVDDLFDVRQVAIIYFFDFIQL